MCDTHSEQINELAKALAAAQGELEPAEKNATAAIGEKGKLSRKYADLTAMIDAVRKVLPKHGLSIAQIVLPTEGVAHVRTMLMHESGQWLASECRMPYDNTGSKNTEQSMGSAITYARRYSAWWPTTMTTGKVHGGGTPTGNRPGVTPPSPPLSPSPSA